MRDFNITHDAKHVLLVEDQAIIALSESMLLTQQGYKVHVTSSGEDAIAFFEGGNNPDIVLMDIDLGSGIDGTEAARRILARWDVPIIFLTSHSSQEMVEKVRGITRYGYVIKNTSDFVLLSTMEMAFELFDKERTIRMQHSILQRAEEIARIGHWFVYPDSSSIGFSESSRIILGIESDCLSFEEYGRLVAADSKDERSAAFDDLVANGTPYDITYRVRNGRSDSLVPVRSSGRKIGAAIVGVIQDLSAIENLLFDLKETERRQAVTLRSIGDGVISTDREGHVVELNSMAEVLTGWKTEEALGRHIEDVFRIVNAMTRVTVENPVKRVIETKHTVGLANHTILIARDGVERHIADSASPIHDDVGAALGIVLIFRDVSQEYREYEILRKNERIFRTIFMESHTPMLLVDPATGGLREANRGAERFYGKSMEELQRMSIYDINAAPGAEIASDMRTAVHGQTEFLFTHRVANNELKPVRVVSGPVSIEQKDYLLSLVFDAGEESEWERKFVDGQTRADTLVRDVHHRMKNNIQMLSGLIRLHMREINDEQIASKLQDLQDRIQSTALVYGQLCQSDDHDVVDSGVYLGSLLGYLRESYIRPPVELRDSLGIVPLNGRLAVSLGLIVTELVINAVKHAFPGGRSGIVSVLFTDADGSGVRLVISDDGIGMNVHEGSSDSNGAESIGFMLVRSLVEQERGVMVIDSDRDGTTVRCFFPHGETG